MIFNKTEFIIIRIKLKHVSPYGFSARAAFFNLTKMK